MAKSLTHPLANPWSLSILSLLGFCLAVYLIIPVGAHFAKNHAAYASAQGDRFAKTNPKQAIANYQVAWTLDRQNPEYTDKLVQVYLDQGMVSQALEIYRKAGNREIEMASLLLKLDRPDEAVKILESKSSPPAKGQLVLAKALIETKAYDSAAKAAKIAQKLPENNEQGIVLEVVAAKLGKKAIPEATVTSQEALQQVRAAQADETALAQLLYNLGLLRSSAEVLNAIASPNASSFKLQAQIKLAQQPTSAENLAQAATYFKKAIEISPYDIGLHRQLRDVYAQIGDRGGADAQSELIKRLEAGTF